MPSGPKKRLRAKRKKQGSPATDANSDRETEALSVSGSLDVDDLESSLDTPGKRSSRSSFLDSEAVSSQTDEWVRVSNFDVGTPTSLAEDNDPSAEDADTLSSRRSLDKLAEWETISEEHIPGRQEGSINSLEEEPSECEAASAHSSDSYTNLPSPHVAEREKEGDSSDSDRKNRITDRSRCSSGSASSTEEKKVPVPTEAFDSSPSVDVREDIFSTPHEPPLPTAGEGQIEDIERLNEDSGEEKVQHGDVPVTTPLNVSSDEINTVVDDTTTSKETITEDPDTEDKHQILQDPILTESNPEDEAHEQAKEEVLTASTESAPLATDQELMSANGKGISEGDTTFPEEETHDEEKEVLPTADKSLTPGSISGDERSSTPSLHELGGQGEDAVAASLVDVEGEEVSKDEKVASPAIDDNPAAADDKQVASTSAKAEEEKSSDVLNDEVATFVEKTSSESPELAADSLSVKALPTSGTSEPMALVEDRHLSVSTLVEKNGTEKHLSEPKSSTGCCGVLYWLLGSDS